MDWTRGFLSELTTTSCLQNSSNIDQLKFQFTVQLFPYIYLWDYQSVLVSLLDLRPFKHQHCVKRICNIVKKRPCIYGTGNCSALCLQISDKLHSAALASSHVWWSGKNLGEVIHWALLHILHHNSFTTDSFYVGQVGDSAHNFIIAAILGPYFGTHNYVATNFKEQQEENIRVSAGWLRLT